MLLLISDASVLIDIEAGKLTDAAFKLPYQFAVPALLFHEELSERHNHLLNYGLVLKDCDEIKPEKIHILSQQHRYRNVSGNDISSLVLAKTENCILLTGDKTLRKLAEEEYVTVHGTLWLVEEMLRLEIISVKKAGISFKQMLNAKPPSFLPTNEIAKLIAKYSSPILT